MQTQYHMAGAHLHLDLASVTRTHACSALGHTYCATLTVAVALTAVGAMVI